jgi:predicted dehydrogenase
MTKPRIGLIGLGAMGRVHFDCWRKSAAGQLVAVSDRDPKKLAGHWAGKEFNLGDQQAGNVDLSDLATHLRAEDLIADPTVEAVDICMPTPMHAPLALAALRAGKHVFCEKPMSLSLDECSAMETAARDAGRVLMIGHCLRYWPQYVKAHEILAGGEHGRAEYAHFHRSGGAPMWSDGDWYMKGGDSGGVLDMHIHDVDVALWWFGRPRAISTTGVTLKGLPLILDSAWHYDGGPAVQIHAAWDRNGGPFRHAFKLVMEKATLVHDLAVDATALHLIRGGKTESVPVVETSAYQAELDDFAACVGAGRMPVRLTPADSRLAVEIGLEELRQLG